MLIVHLFFNVSTFISIVHINISKEADCILDPFHLNINQKRIVQKIYMELEKVSVNEIMNEKTLTVKNMLEQYFYELIYYSDMPLVFEENFNFSTLFSAIGIKYDVEATDVLHRVCMYMEVIHKFLDINIFFLINLKSYLDLEEILALYKMAAYNNIYVVLLENLGKGKLICEKRMVIDNDLCCVFCDK